MQLEAIQEQLEALLSPQDEPGFFTQLWGIAQEPAEVQAVALTALLQQLSPPGNPTANPTRGAALVPYFDAACRELATNLTAVRGLASQREHPPFAYVAWLWRVNEALAGLARDGWLDTSWSLPPRAKSASAPRSSWLLRLPLAPLLPPLRTGPQLQGLAVAPLLDMASRETDQLGRRRRLLEAARRVLLETAASVPQAPGSVQARSLAITEQIREINRWQAAGLDPEVDVAHQLQGAIQRRDAPAVTMLLESLERLSRGSPTPSPSLPRLFAAQQRVSDRFRRFAEPPSVEQLARATFGETAARAVQRGSARAVTENGAAPTAEGELVRVATAVDGSFELGRSVAPVRVMEVQRRMAEVDFPTQTQVLSPARRVSDLPSSLFSDPRLLLHDFASRALLTRRYKAERVQRRYKAERYSEARYYLLDGSASMAGRRGRMRDAILIAELSSMIAHLETGTARARPVVYYRYFSKGSEPLVKASNVDEACAAIEAVLLRKSRGETDIEGALLGCFDELREECSKDDSLRRAQLVLVTDGVARIDLERVWGARERALDIPVQVSVVALGSENDALKQLAAAQRARGEAVFYHFLSDEALYRMARGVRVHAPPPLSADSRASSSPRSPAPPAAPLADETPADGEPPAPEQDVWRELDELVGELSLLREPPDLDGILQAEHLTGAYEELGISLTDVGLEAERARYEARRRDGRALSARFDRWFPAILPQPSAPHEVPRELLEVIEVALLSVVELVGYLGGAPLQRRVDAIELLERLLCEAGVSPWHYCRALPSSSPRARAAIASLRSSFEAPGS
ncbi:MAG TPA: hypothetical protein VEQ59_16400 [Polyangiaceae bacterium]|nr:hypothetical protein [Polyangiaceae bacterium]